MNPDASPDAPSPTPGGPGGSGLPDPVAGALAYLLGPLTGVAFFILDRERDFVRFHAVQCLAVTVGWIGIWVVLMVLGVVLGFIPILGWIVQVLLSLGVGLAGFAFWLFLMYQAYQGKMWAVPGLEPHVRRIAAESAESGGAGGAGI